MLPIKTTETKMKEILDRYNDMLEQPRRDT